MQLLIHGFFSYASTITFGILMNLPRKALLACGLTGMVGWMLFWSTKSLDSGAVFANFLGAMGIGLMSIVFSRIKKMPMTMFNIPALVPLVPGGAAYQAMSSFLLGNYTEGAHYMITVIMTASAIAAGFLVTGIFERLVKKILDYSTTKKKQKEGRTEGINLKQ